MIRSPLAFALSTLALLAQDPAKPAAPAVPLPAANSPEATKLVDQAIAKMTAYGRGAFKTTESQDSAMMRGAGMPFGNDDTEIKGGWHRETVWGEHDGHDYIKANGRMLAKVGDGWKLRGSKHGGGAAVPFTLDPALLFAVLAELPAASRSVVHVEAGEVAGKDVAILSLQLDGEVASDFAEVGVVPGSGGPGGGMMILGAMGGMGGAPDIDHTVYLALSIDPVTGDLVRFAAKVFEKNPMMGNVQIRLGGPGGAGGDEEEEKEDATEEAPSDGPVEWKKGFPKKKPAKDESVATFRVEFSKLGLAEAPQLGDKQKALLRLH